MIGYKRLFNVYELAKTAIDNKIEGDFAECGVWKGGSTAVMGFLAQKEGKNRKTWLFDSFEGLPEPTEKDGFLAKSYSGDKNSGKLESINKCVGLLEDVEKIFFEILKLKKENIIIEKGWFQDVLPDAKKKMGKIAVLRLDGDWYESTKCCLENLYDNVTIGGYIIIDDYGDWEGAKKALDIFFIERNIKPELIKIDHTGVYFKK
ncbi:MAG: TylF/MycF/NovP-related O-methyltransferase [Candidatus Staskawiczbacteria bacterium]|nr:TylF/MycF/NovP-related O-methyltransferase [Candidatus Staskawiczbacteria bacterium]